VTQKRDKQNTFPKQKSWRNAAEIKPYQKTSPNSGCAPRMAFGDGVAGKPAPFFVCTKNRIDQDICRRMM
jgi:hypothetical protein